MKKRGKSRKRLTVMEDKKTYEKYGGKWVAITEDEMTIVGSGETIAEAIAEAKEQGVENPILTRVPTFMGGWCLTSETNGGICVPTESISDHQIGTSK